jgi:hypothetical protein
MRSDLRTFLPRRRCEPRSGVRSECLPRHRLSAVPRWLDEGEPIVARCAAESFEGPLAGLYAAGDGAGHAGAIPSSAVDGLGAAEGMAAELGPRAVR